MSQKQIRKQNSGQQRRKRRLEKMKRRTEKITETEYDLKIY